MDAFFVLGMFSRKLDLEQYLCVCIDLPDRVDFHPYSTVFEIDMLMS